MGGGIASRLMQHVDSNGSLTEEETKQVLGDKFDQAKFDTLKSHDGTIQTRLLSKIWLPKPGYGDTVDTYKVKYIEPPDAGYEVFLHLQLKLWCEAFWGTPDYGSKMWGGAQTSISMCTTMFGSWPRGDGAGQLLLEPIKDEVPVEHRGIAKEWLDAVWAWNGKYMWWTPPTRVWIECFVKPITFPFGCSLYDLVPLQFRKAPDCFISHSWDLALHCIFKGASYSDWNATSYWIDGFAINQHFYGNDIGKIGTIVQDIRNTVVVLRGEGPAMENLRCMYRSWCIYEIVHTPVDCLQCSITAQNGDHTEYANAIRHIDIRKADATFHADKEVMDNLVLQKFGNFEAANIVVRDIMLKGYRDFFAKGHGFGTVGSPDAMKKGKSFGEHYYHD